MSRCTVSILQAGVLFVALFASATEKNALIRITVLDAETHSVAVEGSDVPKNCDQVNFDAYCHNSKTAQVTNTLLVQQGNEPPFRVVCTNETRFSRCLPLPKGQSFDARREKRGLDIYYADDKGKLRQQLYVYVAANTGKTATPTATTNAAPAAPAGSSAGQAAAKPATPVTAAAEPQSSVRCSFSSTPQGAEISLDGRYVGSTPSVLSLSTGPHAVAISLPGFALWKRDLTVSSGSELSVNAVLEKQQ